jgi:hypothetical protein
VVRDNESVASGVPSQSLVEGGPDFLSFQSPRMVVPVEEKSARRVYLFRGSSLSKAFRTVEFGGNFQEDLSNYVRVVATVDELLRILSRYSYVI